MKKVDKSLLDGTLYDKTFKTDKGNTVIIEVSIFGLVINAVYMYYSATIFEKLMVPIIMGLSIIWLEVVQRSEKSYIKLVEDTIYSKLSKVVSYRFQDGTVKMLTQPSKINLGAEDIKVRELYKVRYSKQEKINRTIEYSGPCYMSFAGEDLFFGYSVSVTSETPAYDKYETSDDITIIALPELKGMHGNMSNHVAGNMVYKKYMEGNNSKAYSESFSAKEGYPFKIYVSTVNNVNKLGLTELELFELIEFNMKLRALELMDAIYDELDSTNFWLTVKGNTVTVYIVTKVFDKNIGSALDSAESIVKAIIKTEDEYKHRRTGKGKARARARKGKKTGI